jgi:diaminopimelate decarboxylase
MQTESLSQTYPPLTPVTAPWMTELFDNRPLLNELFRKYGSPINIHHTGPFAENYERYRQVLENHGLNHTVYFARKANKCRVFVKAANRLGFGVDSASYHELKECLDLGCDPGKLVLTAAVKNDQLVRLALQHGVLITLDNRDECLLVNRLAGELGKTPVVGIRISGFLHEGEKLYSRFGFDVDHAAEFITSQLGIGNSFDHLRFGGFHFHLNGYSMSQRSEALLQTIHQADRLTAHGIRTSFIDMGGGILMNYLSDKSEWDEFWAELKKAVRGERPPVTFGNSGLGYELINGELHGQPDVYPYYNETSKDDFLEEVLSYKNHKGETPASLLRKRDIELRMEPGRSLLDQTGITMAKVIHRKKDLQGNWLVGLEMNRSQLASSSADFLVDPVFIPVQKGGGNREPVPVFFTGGYCLEQDVILKRKIVLPGLPEPGDIICFLNTAGYMMHFYETQSHLYDFTTNLVINKDSNVSSIRTDG